jgi:hypothetical protein
MKEFAYFMQVAEEKASLELKRDIVVGLIDDGVDINDPSIQWKTVISGGRSFCYRDKEQNLNQSHYVSGGGHGTTMAKLICKVCPNVKLFVLRLNEFPPLEAGKRQITAESAAKVSSDPGTQLFSYPAVYYASFLTPYCTNCTRIRFAGSTSSHRQESRHHLDVVDDREDRPQR